mmetsp:Transcript_26997/g.68043  ORF Transcript_26997/g.68043 Transcript_26997/m.68043 type:complete len:364 (-) Transcript_26997:1142-2233(-)
MSQPPCAAHLMPLAAGAPYPQLSLEVALPPLDGGTSPPPRTLCASAPLLAGTVAQTPLPSCAVPLPPLSHGAAAPPRPPCASDPLADRVAPRPESPFAAVLLLLADCAAPPPRPPCAAALPFLADELALALQPLCAVVQPPRANGAAPFPQHAFFFQSPQPRGCVAHFACARLLLPAVFVRPRLLLFVYAPSLPIPCACVLSLRLPCIVDRAFPSLCAFELLPLPLAYVSSRALPPCACAQPLPLLGAAAPSPLLLSCGAQVPRACAGVRFSTILSACFRHPHHHHVAFSSHPRHRPCSSWESLQPACACAPLAGPARVETAEDFESGHATVSAKWLPVCASNPPRSQRWPSPPLVYGRHPLP